tara:strand:+ start:75 stop:191 length:117 start_codon:yes stop_codon:yes gene_type:complete
MNKNKQKKGYNLNDSFQQSEAFNKKRRLNKITSVFIFT